MDMDKVTVSLDEGAAQFVREQVESGKYDSPEAVVEKALQEMKAEQAHLEWLTAEIKKGMDDIAAGRVHEFNDQLREEIKAEGRRRAAAQKKPA